MTIIDFSNGDSNNLLEELGFFVISFFSFVIRRIESNNHLIIDFSNGDSNNLLEELGFNPIQKKLFMHYIMLYTATHHTRYVRCQFQFL